MKTFLEKLDWLSLLLIALIATFITIGDFFGFLKTAQEHNVKITLMLLGLLSAHLILVHSKREKFYEETETKLRLIAKDVHTKEVRLFKDTEEAEIYLAKRVLEAKHSVRDLTWKTRISGGFAAEKRQYAHTHMDRCIAKAALRIEYKEIYVFSDARRVDKLNRRLSENASGYSCRYFEKDSEIPRLQFVIIDNNEVVFFATDSESIHCAILSEDICQLFFRYYEAIWSAATVIKDGPKIAEEQVKKIRAIVF